MPLQPPPVDVGRIAARTIIATFAGMVSLLWLLAVPIDPPVPTDSGSVALTPDKAPITHCTPPELCRWNG